MITRSQSRFVAIVLCSTVVQASWFNANIFARQQNERQMEERQILSIVSGAMTGVSGILLGTVATTAATTPPTSPISPVSPTSLLSTTAPTTMKPTTTAPSTSQRMTSSTSISLTISTNTSPTTIASSSTEAQQPSTSENSIPISATTTATALPTVDLITSIVTVSGSVITSISSSTEPTPMPTPTSTNTAGAAVGSDSSTPSGMSTKTKNTVIAVVLGIVGFVILAGLFVVAWRIWGRKKDAEEDDGLMGFRTAGEGHEKSGSVGNTGAANPFQSTLENYHNPARVNASSNF